MLTTTFPGVQISEYDKSRIAAAVNKILPKGCSIEFSGSDSSNDWVAHLRGDGIDQKANIANAQLHHQPQVIARFIQDMVANS